MTYIAFFCFDLLQFFNASSLFLLSVVDSFNFPLFLHLTLSVLHMGVDLMGFCQSFLTQPLSLLFVWGGGFIPQPGSEWPISTSLAIFCKSASGTSPSIWVLQKLLPSLNCVWLGTLADFIFSMVDVNLFPLIHSPPAAHILFFFLCPHRVSLRVSHLSSYARVCVYVCVWTIILFFFHCHGWSFHLFSLLLCASASFLFSLPFFCFYWLIGKHCLFVATNCDCSSDKANKIKFGIPCFREAEPFVWITAQFIMMVIYGLIKFSGGVLVLCFI